VWSFAPAFAVLLAVNVRYARRRADRALVNDLVSVAESCLMVPLAAVVAGHPAGGIVVPAVVVFGYFAGSVLYVKTMIRNRGERGYLIASVAVHLVLAAAAGAVSWPLGVLFGWLAVRAAWWPRLTATTMTPMRVGLIEGVHCLALLVAVPLLLAPR
jgi:hypothetical protein